MGGFRGDDEALDREIAALEGTGRVRLRRANRELRDIDRDLRELRRERARRKAAAALPVAVPETAEASAESR
jgi:hypothetical protein